MQALILRCLGRRHRGHLLESAVNVGVVDRTIEASVARVRALEVGAGLKE